MHVNVRRLLRNFAKVRRAALAGEAVVIATPDGNLVLAAQGQVSEPLQGTAPHAPVRSDADLGTFDHTRETVAGSGEPTGRSRTAGRRRFVPRATIAAAARSAPRIDAERFRDDLDAPIEPCVGG